ncbi:MAG: glycosyltransferase [Bacteroidales bacterium]|nr:glycosyltransferase [Bacteroidales bacterium]MBN2761998.1 glycosyltransferase [Bacteroidales bacterium]
MLSILIPVYNFNVVPLVREVYNQVTESDIMFEIIILDDCSDVHFKEQNRTIKDWKHVKYEELSVNIGRSKIRNKMAGMAAYPWLLFLDCDTQIVRNDYIAAYLEYCDGEIVVCGGRTYRDTKPENHDHYLRWKYGINREQKPAAVRNLRPWHSFMTNNFLMAASVFKQVSFDESIVKYGHEDTFFGIELRRKKIPVLHIDNPLVHIGLESGVEFLAKTKEGVENLYQLLQHKAGYKEELISGIKLLAHFSILKRTRTLQVYWLFFRIMKKVILSNVLGRRPCLLLFDLCKLGFLIEKAITYSKKD